MTPPKIALLVFGVLVVGTSAPLVLFADAPPLAIAFWRNVFAAGLLLPLAALRHGPELRGLGGREMGKLVFAGALLALHFATWIPSVRLTTVSASTVLVNMQPVWAAIGGWLLYREAVRGRAVLGIAIALAGAVFISGLDVRTSGHAFLGDVLALVGGIFAGGYLLAGRALRQRISILTYAGVVYGACALLLLPAMLLSGTPFFGYDGATWLALALIALGPQVIGHTTFNYLLKDLDATTVAVAIMGEPVGATLLALFFFGQVPQAWSILGGVLVLAGIYLAVTAQARRQLVAPVE